MGGLHNSIVVAFLGIVLKIVKLATQIVFVYIHL